MILAPPLRAAPGGRCPPLPPPRYATEYFLTSIIVFYWEGLLSKKTILCTCPPQKALRIITNSGNLAHTEPICNKLRILKNSDMFSDALWKFYYESMNSKLPDCFTSTKPVMSAVTERYEIRNP